MKTTGPRGGGQGATTAPQNEELSQSYRGSQRNNVEYQKVAPFKVFDNLYYLQQQKQKAAGAAPR